LVFEGFNIPFEFIKKSYDSFVIGASINFPYSSKASCTLDIENDEDIDDAPSSANI